nr:SNRPG [Euglena gracilis]
MASSAKNALPDLKRYMDKKVDLKLNGNRAVSGVLRGFDQFMNIVLDETVEQGAEGEKNELGMVVIRGNSVLNVEVTSAL